MVLENILRFLDARASVPAYLGVFHIIWIVLTIATTIALCILWKKEILKKASLVVFIASIILLILGIYKQIVTSFVYDPALQFAYDFDNFPWQFLSMPLVIGLLMGATSGHANKHLSSYFATFGLLAGLWGMFNPNVFVETIGLNVYSMLTYGSIIALAIFVLYSQHVETSIFTFLRAVPVFVMAMSVSVVLNEIGHLIFGNYEFNLFGISRHFESDVPLYSSVHKACLISDGGMSILEYVLCLVLYFTIVTSAALIPLLIAIGIKKLFTTDFDVEYEKSDALALAIKKSEGLDVEDDSPVIFKLKSRKSSKKDNYLRTYFENLHTNFGNNAKGSCGYVATAMVLSYYDTILSDKIVPRQFDKPTISHNEPNLQESPGTRYYQPAFDPSESTYKDYVAQINATKSTHLHEQLLTIGQKVRVVDTPDDKLTTSTEIFGSSSDDMKTVLERYLKTVAGVKKSEYDIHIKSYEKDISDECKKAECDFEKIKEYSNEIREYTIKKIKKGFPVLLGMLNTNGEGHFAVAYDYNSKTDEIYCHMGWLFDGATHARPEFVGVDVKDAGFEKFDIFDSALVLDFDERKLSHAHTNNYEVVIGGALFYYCPDGRYTTCDNMVVEFGDKKKELSIVGVYGKYSKNQLTVPEYIGDVRVANIGNYAFENQEHINQVVLSCNINAIPKKAFEDCESLKTVVIPASVKKIGSEAFGECPNLNSIMYLGTKKQWHSIKKHWAWDRKTGNYRVYCTDGVLIKLHAEGQGELL